MSDARSLIAAVAERRPEFSAAEAEELAARHYGVAAAATPLPSERDQNFRLDSGGGERWVLKIASAAEPAQALDLQNRALEHLARHAPQLGLPRLRPSLAGAPIEVVERGAGQSHLLRLLTWVDGTPLATARPHSPALLRSLGGFYGTLDGALRDFAHPGARRPLQWDIETAGEVIQACRDRIPAGLRRRLVERNRELFEREARPLLPGLRRSVIHNDGNDHNVLVGPPGPDRRVVGAIDFGDMLESITVAELAIAAAYASLGKSDPVAAAAHVVAGYHAALPLEEVELELLYPLIALRLSTSVAVSAAQQAQEPGNAYLAVSEADSWRALEQLAAVNPRFAHYSFRAACALEPCPRNPAVVDWLRRHRGTFAPPAGADLRRERPVVFDLSAGSPEIEEIGLLADVGAFQRLLFERMELAGARVGIGRYDEARLCYSGEQYRSACDEGSETRTVHLGVDLFMTAGSPVYAPLAGTVHSLRNNAQPLDYGPTIILEHRPAGLDSVFYTLYGHLSPDSLETLSAGRPVAAGERVGRVGAAADNGGWPPHVHFEVVLDLLGRSGDFPGVAAPSQRAVWLSLCPDPSVLLGVADGELAAPPPDPAGLLAARRRLVGRNLSLSYRAPLHIVRGHRQFLYDARGQRYLDGVNNVAHVGHGNPRVVRAAARQMAVLNTNTRYLHQNLVRYAERLTAALPEPLRVCFFVSSGSEANDLALRLARAHTGRRGVVVLDGAYHGNLTSLVDVSPYKFDGPGGGGAPRWVRRVPAPDPYRGLYRSPDPWAGAAYARHVEEAVDDSIAAFLAEAVPGCAGQIVPPAGFLEAAYRHARAGGAVCIADEVQTGLGRVGSHFWAFETQGAVPDIVTAGKPIGNGHPLGAVTTTPEIAASFDNGMEYFNTYGGNPVSCAVGLAVLDEIEREALQQRAGRVGARLQDGLRRLARSHALIGDVRGHGLFQGLELVLDRETLEPAPLQAAHLVERLKELGLLLGADGPHHNVIKIKPPLVFGEADADRVVELLDRVFAEDLFRQD
jgi:4-aminobutyrate aminotransferase-like enzyme/Ser/Thr protein kinase RdoA (MazF antagonist)